MRRAAHYAAWIIISIPQMGNLLSVASGCFNGAYRIKALILICMVTSRYRDFAKNTKKTGINMETRHAELDQFRVIFLCREVNTQVKENRGSNPSISPKTRARGAQVNPVAPVAVLMIKVVIPVQFICLSPKDQTFPLK